MNKLNRVIITGDFSRINKGKIEQEKNIEWLFNILKTPISFATNSEVKFFPSKEDQKIVNTILSEIGIMGIESWVSRYNTNIASEYVYNMLKDIFENSLVVCLEMPFWLENILAKIDCVVIEVIFHPVRFMPDLLLGFASKNKIIDDILEEFRVPLFNIYSEASLIKAYNGRLENKSYFNEAGDYLLITGQMDVDRSLIDGAHLKSIFDYEKELIEHSEIFDNVIYKPHPYMLKSSSKKEILIDQLVFLKKIFKNIRTTSMDFYWLISQREITKVLSLSSGTGIESIFFGKDSTFLYKYLWSVDNQKIEDAKFFYPIDQSFLYPNFWKKLLSPFMDVLDCDFNILYQKNRLRKSIIQSWGFSINDLGAEKRLLDIDEKNIKLSNAMTADIVKQLNNMKIYPSKLDTEFKKYKNDKNKMTIFLTSILNNLTIENKAFLLKELLKLDSHEEAEEISSNFSEYEIFKLLESIGKFGCLNRLDINFIYAKQKGK